MWNDGSHTRPIHAADELSNLLHDVRLKIEQKAVKKQEKEIKRHNAAVTSWNVASAAILMKSRLRQWNAQHQGEPKDPATTWSLVRTIVFEDGQKQPAKRRSTDCKKSLV
jgi:hypothetical protein